MLTTLKEGGLDAYDLSGALVQHVAPDATPAGQELNSARNNNVDLIDAFKVGNTQVDLAVATLVDRVREFGCEFDFSRDHGLGSPYLTADVEGLTIYKAGSGTWHLLVSSQASDEFLVYDRQTLEHLGNFH